MSVFVAVLVNLDGYKICLPQGILNVEPTRKPHHITLSHLDGPQSPEQITEIAKVISTVSVMKEFPPGLITLNRWGRFGPNYELLALHSEERDTTLHKLARTINLRLLLAQTSVSQQFPFHPHVSIARLFGKTELIDAIQPSPLVILYDRICMMLSVKDQSHYTILSEFPLTAAGS